MQYWLIIILHINHFIFDISRIREIKYMQHEDINGYIMRRAEELETEERKKKIKKLESLYKIHQPFQFKVLKCI